jgi:hypothetical protein
MQTLPRECSPAPRSVLLACDKWRACTCVLIKQELIKPACAAHPRVWGPRSARQVNSYLLGMLEMLCIAVQRTAIHVMRLEVILTLL